MNDLIKVTSDELSKVENNLLNTQQLNFLLSPTPKAHIYDRPAKGGGTWKYVTGTYVKKVLNLMFGWDWSFEIIDHDVSIEYRQVVVKGKLTVHSNGRDIVKMQFGRQDIKFRKGSDQPLDIGNDLKGATTDCLKKCASELGIASDVYAPNEFKAIKVIEELPDLLPDTDDWAKAVKGLQNGILITQLEKKWNISETARERLLVESSK